MTNVLSRLHGAIETWSFKYNCYEAVHPWTPYCSHSALDIGLTVFGEAVKLYTPLYLFTQLLQRRFDSQSFKITAQSILRSTTFISANAFFSILFFCLSPYFTGKFYYYAVAYIPGFVASSMAVLIEKPSRRASLAFYVANVASEALFRIYVARGYLKPVPNGQVYLFALSMATIMALAKRRGFEDDPLSSAIKMIVGPEEAGSGRQRRQLREPPTPTPTPTDKESEKPMGEVDRLKRILVYLYQFATGSLSAHRLCNHRQAGCLYYATRSSARAALIGYGAQLCLRLVAKAPQLMANDFRPAHLLQLNKTLLLEPLKLGLFLGSFTGLYKAASCLMRHQLDRSDEATCFFASLLAGPTMLLYPSPTVALYVLWKCLEALFHESVSLGWIKRKDVFIVLLYGLATSQLFYSALMNPAHMKRSYMSFLDRMSHHKLHMVNRSVLDVFGTSASAGYEDFFPDLHPKFMSRAFLGSIWIWMIELKFPKPLGGGYAPTIRAH